MKTPRNGDCFVVMPISDPPGYAPGHFKCVFDDLIAPACDAAGYRPLRADMVTETNPNVMFELGIRQAFDKPVVLVQELGTPEIFDIAPLRYTTYRPDLSYRRVLEDQRFITDALTNTARAYAEQSGINSLVRLLGLSQPAHLSESSRALRDPRLQIVLAEVQKLRDEIKHGMDPWDIAAGWTPTAKQSASMVKRVEQQFSATVSLLSRESKPDRATLERSRADLEAALRVLSFLDENQQEVFLLRMAVLGVKKELEDRLAARPRRTPTKTASTRRRAKRRRQ
jgi:hypothetical protein